MGDGWDVGVKKTVDSRVAVASHRENDRYSRFTRKLIVFLKLVEARTDARDEVRFLYRKCRFPERLSLRLCRCQGVRSCRRQSRSGSA